MRLWRAGPAIVMGFTIAASCSTQGRDDDDDGGKRLPGPTEECEAECIPLHPSGEAAYLALRECQLCRACANLCAPDVGALCEPQPDFDGCSAGYPSCEDCIASACALEQKPDTSFVGTCAPEGEGCLQTQGCVALNNCVAVCVANHPGTGGAGGTSATSGVGGFGGNKVSPGP